MAAPHPAILRKPAGAGFNVAPVLWIGLLVTACYFPTLRNLFEQWQSNEDMGHGLFVPLFAGYVAWERRREIESAFANSSPDQGYRWGLALMVWAFLQYFIASLAAELFVQRIAVLLSIAGSVLYLGGQRVFRAVAFPLLLLLFCIPIPGIALKSVTFPLQLLSSQWAEGALEVLGYTVVRDGNVLELAGQQLSVVEACNGIRAILSLSFFSVCYAYLFDNRVAMRWILLAATIPVAMLANGGRIVITGILAEIDQKLATGFFHTASGWVIFVISIVLIIGIHKITLRIGRKPAEASGVRP